MYGNLEIACNKIIIIFYKGVVSGPLLKRDTLWFDSYKWPLPVSNHQSLNFRCSFIGGWMVIKD